MQCECIDPANQGEALPDTCWDSDYQGDSYCDDANNNEGCEYDGGDCCAQTVDGGTVKTNYCTQVCVEVK